MDPSDIQYDLSIWLANTPLHRKLQTAQVRANGKLGEYVSL